MSKRTLILIAILLAITAGLLVLAFSPLRKPQVEKPSEKIAELPYAQTVLTVSKPILSGDTYTANVLINTGTNNIDAVQLEMTFDPTQITDVEVSPGTFLVNPIVLIDEVNPETGSVSYAISSAPGQESKGGTGIVAVITFQQLGAEGTETAINFEPKTLVSSQEIDKPILKSATGITFTLQEVAQATSPSANTEPQAQ